MPFVLYKGRNEYWGPEQYARYKSNMRRKAKARAARKIQRAFRKRRGRRSKSRLVQRWAPSEARKAKVWSFHRVDSTWQQQTLLQLMVDMPSARKEIEGSAFGALDSFAWPGLRNSSRIFVKGVRINHVFTNMGLYHYDVHFAIIQNKGNEVTPNSFNKTEFFRRNHGRDEREVDFVDSPTADPHPEYKWLKINPDRWHIITHQKFQLQPREFVEESTINDPGGSYTSQTIRPYSLKESKWQHTINKYFPVKRWFNFDTKTDVPERPILMVAWYVPRDDIDYAAAGDNAQIKHGGEEAVFFVE